MSCRVPARPGARARPLTLRRYLWGSPAPCCLGRILAPPHRGRNAANSSWSPLRLKCARVNEGEAAQPVSFLAAASLQSHQLHRGVSQLPFKHCVSVFCSLYLAARFILFLLHRRIRSRLVFDLAVARQRRPLPGGSASRFVAGRKNITCFLRISVAAASVTGQMKSPKHLCHTIP